MKHLLSTLFLFIAFAIASNAQSYSVFSVRGDVRVVKGKATAPIKLRQELEAQSRVAIPSTGKLILLDKANSKLYTINKPYSGTIANLLADDARCSMKNLSRQYLRYLVNQMAGKGVIETRTCYMDRTASAYRDVEPDSTATDSTIVVEENRQEATEK